MPTITALIPARAGSKRIPGKNVKRFREHPLIGYTIDAALRSEIFEDVIVSTESEEYRSIALEYGASVPFARPSEMAGDRSPDIEWVRHALETLQAKGALTDAFAILRPTNPFRSPETICRAWEQFAQDGKADSLRAVELCAQHPAKMWRIEGSRMSPVMQNPDQQGVPWHSSQYPSLPTVYVQNASLEIAWSRVPLEQGSIAGTAIMPFVSQGFEGFDLNRQGDWIVAEHLVQSGQICLPELKSRREV
ncbi:MAG: acylneuraminate cytidylyltransferase family protein [Actinobacteria bacterium]|nr:MAG: acylneuraminate cytidylyltransferase family protein [Actinomycetota bacterium]